MPKRRANGEGNIRKRKDGRWEGRYTVGHDPETGKAIIKNALGKTQAAVKEKLKKAIEENVGIDYGRTKTYTVGSWLEAWMENYAKVEHKEMKTLTTDQLSAFFQEARDSSVYELYYLDLATGLRRGELLVLKRAGLPRIRFHDLRHTFATMALQNGVDVKTVSSMLGHYSAGFTLDTYAHVTTDAQLKAAQTMGNILSRAV